jgi:hypothetical protein
MSKTNNKLPLKAFVYLMAINLVATGVFVLMAHNQEAKYDIAMFGLSIFSMIFAVFQIYIKDIVLGEKWSDVSPVIKVIWWFMFLGNSLNFIQHFMDAFILNR